MNLKFIEIEKKNFTNQVSSLDLLNKLYQSSYNAIEGILMSKIFYLVILFFVASCTSNNKLVHNYKNNEELEYGSIKTVKPNLIKESAYESFYISEKLEAELNKIQFSSATFLKGNEDCIGLIRLSISGSIDYYQLIQTLKKRTYDIGGNAIGVYDYKETRRVLVNQHGYEVKNKNRSIFESPEIKYVLVKENRKVAKITADIFRCTKQST